ncbi:MAG: GlgB N-terminal domain-containing protein, partial [Burkholderiales bacterium]
MKATVSATAEADLDALVGARHHDPFGVLGLHRDGKGWMLRVFRPYASEVAV